MKNGFAVVNTQNRAPETFWIVSRHRTQAAAEAAIGKHLSEIRRVRGNENAGVFEIVLPLVDGAIQTEEWDRTRSCTWAGATLANLRWSKPDADRDQPRQAGKLGGRPRSPDRCPCQKYTRKTAESRKHKCFAADSVSRDTM